MKDRYDKEICLHRRFIRSYKKNTIAIFLSFLLTFILLTAMLVLLHTNHRIANIQDKRFLTPSDCSIEELSREQADHLKKDTAIEYTGVEQEGRYIYERNNQTLFLSKGDDTAITMMSKVMEGRLPKQEGEVAAERWVLLNLGIEPVIGQKFVTRDFDTKEEKEFKLVGILSDMFGNKKYGTINLYSALDKETEDKYIAYIRLKDNVDYHEKMESLISELGINASQIKICPAREDFSDLYRTDVKVICVLLLICMVVFYGIYRIASMTREKQYGILRAVGMTKKQLQKTILLELYEIYIVSAPVGVGVGLLLSHFIMHVSGDKDTEIYLYGEKVKFVPVIPGWQILGCAAIVAVLIGIVGYLAGRKVLRASVTETISGTFSGRREQNSRFGIGQCRSKTGTLFHMGCKYIFRDIKTSCFVILTVCLGVTLFTGLVYRAQLLKVYREDTKEMWYLNGQYAMNMQNFRAVDEGISRQSAEEVQKVDTVATVKTAAGLPVRVIDEDGIKRNDAYYDDLNDKLKEFYGYTNVGNDGTNQIYKSVLYGYNKIALEELKKYLISGDYDPGNIRDDEIILSVLRMDDTKENELPGSFKEGTPLMEYKAGDKIQIKYRADFKTDSMDYDELTDTDSEYIYKTYKIAAIVSFPYMFDCNRTVYPLMITSDRQIQEMVPDSHIQCMYVDGMENMSLSQQMDLEHKLIKICNQNNNVSTRSLIEEINENEMFYRKQMVYIQGIAIVAFILVMINMVNNLRYRMQTRTREISMLRAIGMSVAMTKRMLLFENTVLGAAAVFTAFLISQPVLRYLYQISDMKAFGHTFQYTYGLFGAVSAAALGICILLSFGILKSWKTKRIIEGMGNLE
ncbi:MAG: ABC transporter permease [Eubacteriales bacterium]|nr:ABC transporter permease [Eubacteriales bacterium]